MNRKFISCQEYVLTINAGSSSLKAALVGSGGQVAVKISFEAICESHSTINIQQNGKTVRTELTISSHDDALRELAKILEKDFGSLNISAVGHRVVHGGKYFSGSVLIDGQSGEVTRAIAECCTLAPLHNPANLSGINAALTNPRIRDIPNVAIFDTAFHARMPQWAKWYAVPTQWREEDGIERYGFHGTSFTYVARMFRQFNHLSIEDNQLVIAHLGNGCSMAKVEGLYGTDTSMGTTPLEGLIMGTRVGDIDAGVILQQMQKHNLSPLEMGNILNNQSGLLGAYSGGIKDMQILRNKAQSGDKLAEQVIDMVAYRVAGYFGRYLGTLRNPRGIVFTAGIGENETTFREKVLSFLPMFNWQMLQEEHASHGYRIAESQTIPGLFAWVIPTNEELIFAEDALSVARNGTAPDKYSFETYVR